ncbi:MAG TPA: hypothetical protein VEU95_16855 [Micropepsaceae bacterium]|nr:hypothetical protein [Micropepsaceae bacterium]
MKFNRRRDLGKGMIASEPSILRVPHQPYELPFLLSYGVLPIQRRAAPARMKLEERRAVDHGL